jgi:hypothetical protein
VRNAGTTAFTDTGRKLAWNAARNAAWNAAWKDGSKFKVISMKEYGTQEKKRDGSRALTQRRPARTHYCSAAGHRRFFQRTTSGKEL